jgi:AsmA protein
MRQGQMAMNETAQVKEQNTETAPVAGNDTGNTNGLRRKMVQAGWVIGGIAAFGGATAVGASLLLTATVLNSNLAAQIRHATGLTTEIHGAARFSLLPQPHINIDQISFANAQAGLDVETDNFTGYLRLLPLLAGRVEVGHAILYRPHMRIDVDDRPITKDSAIGRAANVKPATPEAAAIDQAKLAIVDFIDGSARLHSQAASHDVLVDNINVTADWRSLDTSATLTGGFRFGGVPMQVKAWLARPIEALRGGTSSAFLQLDSDAIKLLISGHISAAPHFQYSGTLTASSPSLRGFAHLAGLPFATHGRFGLFDLHCDANINRQVSTLTNVSLHLDGNDYEGTLAVQANDGLRQLTGTLATNALDATPFLDGVPSPSISGHWNNEPVELTDLGFTNLDLRLSATRLRLRDIELQEAALSVLTRPGFIDLSLAEAQANGGKIRGRLTLSGQGKGLEMHATANAADVGIKPLVRGQTVKHPISGAISGSFMLDGKGESFDQLVHNLSGHAEFNIANGELTGVDLQSALQHASPQHPKLDSSKSVTAFNVARFGLQITNGVATIVNGRLQADTLSIAFGGSADLGDRNLDLSVVAQPLVAQAQPPGLPLALGIKGPWNDVQVTADRPSTATAPAFEQ